MRNKPWDTIIIGGGPAGLSAALVLGRCCRRVLLCDAGKPRNRAAQTLNGFLTRDGIAPSEFLEVARQQLRRYTNVEFWDGEVSDVTRESKKLFRVGLDATRHEYGRKILIATGVTDQLPALPRIAEFWGKSAHQCPYCDGWEVRGAPIAVYGKRDSGVEMARAMTAWTSDIALCTDGRSGISQEAGEHLKRNGVELIEERIVALEGEAANWRLWYSRAGVACRAGRYLLIQRACRTCRSLAIWVATSLQRAGLNAAIMKRPMFLVSSWLAI